MAYPMLLIDEGPCEIIACGPMRFRLLYDGRLVATFKRFTQAVHYMDMEFKESAQ